MASAGGRRLDPQLADEDLVAESHRQDAEPDTLLVGRPGGQIRDEYRLFVYPMVQGRGPRLFSDGTVSPKLESVEPPKSFTSGITLLRYGAA
jgi:hypothetical protein